MNGAKLTVLAGAMGLLSSCGGGSGVSEPPLKPLAGVSASCPVLGSRKWEAALKRTGGPATKLTLRVKGEVDLPTPGFTPVWRIGISDRANPPGLQLVLSFDPPREMVAQVVTINPIEFTADVAYPRYRYILIRCGDAALARIAEVQVQP